MREEGSECDVGVGVSKHTIVIAVLGVLILTGLVGWRAFRFTHQAVAIEGKVPHDIKAIESACEWFAELNGGMHPDSIGLLVVPDKHGQRFLNMAQVPRDPWGRAYQYEAPTCEGALPRIWTRGRDGVLGGEGEDQDIGNWMLR